MASPLFIEIDGKRYLWGDLVAQRKAKMRALSQSASQPFLLDPGDCLDNEPGLKGTSLAVVLRSALQPLGKGGQDHRRSLAPLFVGSSQLCWGPQ